MTTPTTLYALFRFVPLSECRNAWRVWHRPRRHDPRTGETWRKWSEHMRDIYCERALAAVTAERDELQRALDGALDNLEHVTAERDALRREHNDLLAERDALQFAATQVARDRDALQMRLNALDMGGP